MREKYACLRPTYRRWEQGSNPDVFPGHAMSLGVPAVLLKSLVRDANLFHRAWTPTGIKLIHRAHCSDLCWGGESPRRVSDQQGNFLSFFLQLWQIIINIKVFMLTNILAKGAGNQKFKRSSYTKYWCWKYDLSWFLSDYYTYKNNCD